VKYPRIITALLSIAGTSTVDQSGAFRRTLAMNLNNIVTFGCSFGVDHRITHAGYDNLSAKPSDTFGLVPLRSCAGRNICLSECEKSHAESQGSTCMEVRSQLRWGLHNMHARARKRPHPIRWCSRQPTPGTIRVPASRSSRRICVSLGQQQYLLFFTVALYWLP
jgi:hypothetical protein